MNNKISHSGVVENIEDGCAHVRIVQSSACAACKVAGYCHAAEAHALLLGFGIPFVLMVLVLVLVLWLTGNEAKAALSGLAALAPYYGVLYLFRDRIRDKLSFSIEEQDLI